LRQAQIGRYQRQDFIGKEISKLGASPGFAVGSVQAVTEDGQVVIASKTGSQIDPHASGAGKIIWVVGAQKIVKGTNQALQRINEYNYPLEEEHMQQLYKVSTGVNKILILNKEITARSRLEAKEQP